MPDATPTPEPAPAPIRPDAFRWIVLGLAILAALWLGWAVNDLRTELKASTHAVNQHLPAILARTEQSTETLATLASDIKDLRDLAGAAKAGAPRDASLVRYADSVLDLLEQTPGKIGLPKKLTQGVKKALPTADWVRGARKEALWLSFRAKSKKELLQRLCKNAFGSPWLLVLPKRKPQPLLDWLKANHAESGKLFETP